jgi:fructooligosaccharide transport system substrate-binding protein
MKTEKRIGFGYLVTLLIAIALIASACAQAQPTGAVVNQPTTSGEQPTSVAAESTHEPVSLRFFEWAGQPQNDIHVKLINDFMAKYPWIKVEIQVVPFTEYYQTIAAQSSAHNLADVVAADIPNISNYAYNGIILPLVPYVYSDTEAQKELQDFLPSIVDQGTYNGKLYALAVKDSAVAMYYNTDIVSAAGIQPPSTLADAWDMEKAREVWLQLTKRSSPDSPPEIWGVLGRGGGLLGNGSYHGVGYIRSAGAPGSPTYMGMSADGLSIDGYMNTPEAIAALQFLQDLHQKDKVAPLEVIQNGFETGKAAFYEFPEQEVAVLESQYPDLHWSVMPLPYFKTGFTHDGSFAYVISSDTKHPNEAGMLIRFLVSPESSLYFQQAGKSLPVRKSIFEQITDYQTLPRKIFYDELINWGHGRQKSVAYSEYASIVNAGIQDILLGAPVQQRVDQMVKDFQTAAAAYKK